MATTAEAPPSTRPWPLPIAVCDAVERRLEAERAQLFLWAPVMLGVGVTAWFVLPGAAQWAGFLLACAGVALGAVACADRGRLARVVSVGAMLAGVGCALIWVRAERASAPVLGRPVVAAFAGEAERVEPLPARGLVRVRVRVTDGVGLPARVRVNLSERDVPAGLGEGAVVRLRARLMPPAAPAVPGAYDFARVAWFDGIGATGRGFAPVVVERAGEAASGLRGRLTAHIQRQVPGSAGGVAAALATGDRGAIAEADDEAMRRSGLAHLLSVSGLHITAAVGAAMLLVRLVLGLSMTMAERMPLRLISAGVGACVAVGYTLLTGAEVPTVRSCVAALMVLAALALGREALTLRLVAVGAIVVLALWPEALAGPSFQLSFAAVTAIIALHEHPRVKAWFGPHEEGVGRRLGRGFVSLLATGMVVEAALMPIGLYHFHKAGVYGALANLVAIPWTTFVVMPLEALALLLDVVGLGAPLWWMTGQALALLLGLAQAVAHAPGASAALPAMPDGAFGLIVVGGLWAALWRTGMRWLGVLPFFAGLGWAVLTPAPDMLVTGDGRHVAIRTAGVKGEGGMAMLRARTGDYMQGVLGENSGVETLETMDARPEARCSRDVCLADVAGRRVLATRSGYAVPWAALVDWCGRVDIVVSERRLPEACRPRWLKLDRAELAQGGGAAVRMDGDVRRVRASGDRHPWVDPPVVMPPFLPQRSAGR